MIVVGILGIAACLLGMAFISFCVTMFLCLGTEGIEGPAVIGVIVFIVQVAAFVMSLMSC